MRLITVKGPKGSADNIARIAFSVGIAEISVYQKRSLRAGEAETANDIIDIETATPTAKRFIDALLAAPFFDQDEYAYGMIQFKLLFMIAGLLFIPLLAPMLAVGFGT